MQKIFDSNLGLSLVTYGILDHLFSFMSLWTQKWPYFDNMDVPIKRKKIYFWVSQYVWNFDWLEIVKGADNTKI